VKIKKIFGSPGTGKTTYLLNTLEELLKTYNPEEIAYVSFTKKGSYEGRDRAIKRFGFKENQTPFFRTLHSIAFNQLGLNRSDVIDKQDYKEFSKQLGMNFVGYYTEELKHGDDLYLHLEYLGRNNIKAVQSFLPQVKLDKLTLVLKSYPKFKEKMRILDFTDMIEMFIKKDIVLPVKIAIVDEAQDLTTLQWEMIFKAFKNVNELYIAGDDDQAIYEWSGADINKFIETDFKEIKILDKTYRLPDNILTLSKKIVERITNRVPKWINGTGKKGTISHINNFEDLLIDNQKQWLFLSRNNCFLKKVEDYCRGKGLLYNYKGEPSFNKRDFDIIKQYTYYQGADKNLPLPSIIKANIKEQNFKLEWYDNLKWEPEKITYYRDLIKKGIHKEPDQIINININTIHTVKGGEADNVVLLQDMTKNVYNNLETNPDSENRIFYVGITRSKENLYFMQGTGKYNFEI
jgi:superfamily I DNA/RNA helicase